ncbi:MAG: cytochrome P450 [Ilumatobacteraceae bacterium]
MTPVAVPLGSFDLSDPAFWIRPRDYREGAFEALRDAPQLQFFQEWKYIDPTIPVGAGYYALARYEDVWHVSRNPQLFCSSPGSNIADLPQEMNEFFGSMINMDDPKHFRLRSIVSKGFTPKQINKVEEYVRHKAAAIVDGLLERFPEGECDFVEEVAAPLPLQIICEMMGIPSADEPLIFNWTNVILGVGDPEYATTLDELMAAAMGMFAYAQALGESRRANPTDDLTSAMMNAEVDGEQLTPAEFGSFFILLAAAGNETTRNAITHGMCLLTEHPDQRQVWFDDFAGVAKTAVDEIVRYATPVIHFRRTVTEDTRIGDTELHAGDKVVMWYASANRDERAFTDPHRFDVRRPLQPQQAGFGAGGPHFCLGANLARREIAVMFDEIRRRLPKMRTIGEPAYLQSAFINGIKRQRCSWS